MLKRFDIRMHKSCKKNDYIIELIYCLDNMYDDNQDS